MPFEWQKIKLITFIDTWSLQLKGAFGEEKKNRIYEPFVMTNSITKLNQHTLEQQ